MEKTFWKTLVTVEVLTEDAPYSGHDLEDLAYEITQGHASGAFQEEQVTQLTPQEACDALVAQGSDPEFFGLITNAAGKHIGFVDFDNDGVYDSDGNELEPVDDEELRFRRTAAVVLKQAKEGDDLTTFVRDGEYRVGA